MSWTGLNKKILTGAWIACCWVAGPMALAADFEYKPVGVLLPGSGTGCVDETVYVPGMRFPIEAAPAYANSQVWGHGGMYGPGGGECDAENYAYPWYDNFCETRDWAMPLCTLKKGHQGQDIRPSTCENGVYWTVAAEDGTITDTSSYVVRLTSKSGVIHRYLHGQKSSLAVNVGDVVTKGQRLIKVSNDMGGTPTTIHLHYDINMNVAGVGQVYVSPYMSLVRSYEELIGVSPQQCTVAVDKETIIEEDSPCATRTGNSSYWHSESVGHGGQSFWTYTIEKAIAENSLRWNLDFVGEGRFEVFAYVSSDVGPSIQGYTQQASYGIYHNGQSTAVVTKQVGGDWQSLGVFQFSAGRQWVELGDNTGEPYTSPSESASNRKIIFDAIRLMPEAGPQEEEILNGEDGGGADGADSGDNAADKGSDSGGEISGCGSGCQIDEDQSLSRIGLLVIFTLFFFVFLFLRRK